MSSKFITLYKAVQDFSKVNPESPGLEFTFDEKTFNSILEEADGLSSVLGINPREHEYIQVKTPGGTLRINKR